MNLVSLIEKYFIVESIPWNKHSYVPWFSVLVSVNYWEFQMSLNQFSQLRQRTQAKHSTEKKNHKKWRRQICESISNLRPGLAHFLLLGLIVSAIGHWTLAWLFAFMPGNKFLLRACVSPSMDRGYNGRRSLFPDHAAKIPFANCHKRTRTKDWGHRTIIGSPVLMAVQTCWEFPSHMVKCAIHFHIRREVGKGALRLIHFIWITAWVRFLWDSISTFYFPSLLSAAFSRKLAQAKSNYSWISYFEIAF